MTILRSSVAALMLAFAADGVTGETQDATLATVGVLGAGRIVVNCADQRLPSLRAVAELLQTNNSGEIYRARERLAHTAHRECARGTAWVAFVRDSASSPPALAMVDVPARQVGDPTSIRRAGDARGLPPR